MTLTELKTEWVDTPEFHKAIHEAFTDLVNADPTLKSHRDWCDVNFHGLGERSFGWAWKQICQDLTLNPKMCEIGVLRGQIISLWKLLRPDAIVLGITPMDSSGNVWESDYKADIAKIHDYFGLEQPLLYKGFSQDNEAVMTATLMGDLDCLYIDGSHEYADVLADFKNYALMVKQGGWLVVDDACCEMKMWWGAFQGVQEVTDATLRYMRDKEDMWEFQGNVMHLRLYRRR